MKDNPIIKWHKVLASNYHSDKLREISKKRKISIARLVSFAIDNEMSKSRPFDFDCSFSETDDYQDNAFADESGKILNFMAKLREGAGLDILILCRFDMGIPDKEIFLVALKDCIDKKVIEAYKPKTKSNVNNPEDYYYYRLTGQKKGRTKKNHEGRYAQYLKLKGEFEK